MAIEGTQRPFMEVGTSQSFIPGHIHSYQDHVSRLFEESIESGSELMSVEQVEMAQYVELNDKNKNQGL